MGTNLPGLAISPQEPPTVVVRPILHPPYRKILMTFLLLYYISSLNFRQDVLLCFPFLIFIFREVIILSYRMISNPSDITPTFAIDSVDDLPKLLKDGYDEQGTCALIVPTSEVYMVDGKKTWYKLG